MPGRKTGLGARVVLGLLALTLVWLGFGNRNEYVLPDNPEPSPSATASSVTSNATASAMPSSSPTVVGPTSSVPTSTAQELPTLGESMPVKITIDTIDGNPSIHIERDFAPDPVRPKKVNGQWEVHPPVESLHDLAVAYLTVSDTPELIREAMPSNPASAGIYVDGHTCRDRNGVVCDGAFDRLQETEGRPIRIKLMLGSGYTLVYEKFWSNVIPKPALPDSAEFYDGVPGILHLAACNLRPDGGASTDNYVVKAKLVAVERWR